MKHDVSNIGVQKGPSEKSILLEEYVDSLHFFLSIANYRQYDVDRLYDVYSV